MAMPVDCSSYVQKVVEVSADRPRGKKPGGEGGVARPGHSWRQKPQLDLARHREILLHPLFLKRHPLVEPRILDGDGDLRGQRDQRALVVFVEVIDPGMFEVEHADDRALVNERHHHLRAGLRIDHEVARILAHIPDMDEFALPHRRSHQPAVQRDLLLRDDGVPKAHGIADFEHLLALVQQQDAEHLVVDQPAQQLRDPFEQRIEVENRCDFARDLVEHGKRLRLAGDPGIETRIFDGLGDP